MYLVTCMSRILKTASKIHWICFALVTTTLKIHITFFPAVLICLAERNTLLKKIADIDNDILNQVDRTVIKTLVFGNWSTVLQWRQMQILNASIEFIVTSTRFGFSRYWKYTITPGDCNVFVFCVCVMRIMIKNQSKC